MWRNRLEKRRTGRYASGALRGNIGDMAVGFAGLGLMGHPMAANLVRAGVDLITYNRSRAPLDDLAKLGARPVDTPAALFAACDTILLMLADDAAVDFVLGRGGPEFRPRMEGRLIINMGTHAPAYSSKLAADIRQVGGEFVEAPVSGSRGPAVAGELVVMMAGEDRAVERAWPLLAPLCRSVLVTGQVPSALAMKLAVNLYLIASVAALAEATNVARAFGLDLNQFQQVIASGPLGSDVARAKLDKMISGQFAPQATIRDVCKNAALVEEAANGAEAPAPLLRQSRALFDMALAGGAGALDMAAVIDVLAATAMERS
jgi:3-hydroxyisobutyrate dehydrogenase